MYAAQKVREKNKVYIVVWFLRLRIFKFVIETFNRVVQIIGKFSLNNLCNLIKALRTQVRHQYCPKEA